jgi:GntR family transcriptional regulator
MEGGRRPQMVKRYEKVSRQRAERSNLRHQWEKDRARADLRERKRTGATERDTGLTIDRLAFRVEYEQIEAPEELAAALNLEPGDAVLKRTYRTHSVDEDEPLNVARPYMERASRRR